MFGRIPPPATAQPTVKPPPRAWAAPAINELQARERARQAKESLRRLWQNMQGGTANLEPLLRHLDRQPDACHTEGLDLGQAKRFVEAVRQACETAETESA